jgi:hypothetical protein
MVGETCFYKDIERGKPGENIFKAEFLDFLRIDYVDVTGCQQFQVLDTDFKTRIGMYEIKANYKDDRQVIIEEYTNVNENLCPISYGWFYKSQADLLIFISKKTHTMVFIPFTKQMKNHYEQIKDTFKLWPNKVSVKGNRKWQSAYRRIPLVSIAGYYSMYKKIMD